MAHLLSSCRQNTVVGNHTKYSFSRAWLGDLRLDKLATMRALSPTHTSTSLPTVLTIGTAQQDRLAGKIENLPTEDKGGEAQTQKDRAHYRDVDESERDE